MTKRKTHRSLGQAESRDPSAEQAADPRAPQSLGDRAAAVEGAFAAQAGPSDPGEALVEPAQEAVVRLTQELEDLRDRHLRLAAEFDNFRKRMARERSELRARAQAEVIANTLDALDDLGRVREVDPSTATVEDVLSGVQLVERKLLRELETAGLKRVGRVGEEFDPHLHEAVGAVPAASPEHDGTVAAVFQIGYQFGDVLVRPARVQVAMAQEGHTGGESGPEVART